MKSISDESQNSKHELFRGWTEDSSIKTLEELKVEMNLYLIAKIWPDAHSWNEEVVSKLKDPVKIFVPHLHNPYNTLAKNIKHEVHDIDLEAICKSQGAILLPPYGNDCSYEVGIYKMMNVAYGKGRILFPVIAIIKNEVDFLNDWMVKAGITHVIVQNSKIYKQLKSDPMLGNIDRGIIKINSLDRINDIILDIVLSTRSKSLKTIELKSENYFKQQDHIQISLAAQVEA
jgi:hypothetical protein